MVPIFCLYVNKKGKKRILVQLCFRAAPALVRKKLFLKFHSPYNDLVISLQTKNSFVKKKQQHFGAKNIFLKITNLFSILRKVTICTCPRRPFGNSINFRGHNSFFLTLSPKLGRGLPTLSPNIFFQRFYEYLWMIFQL